MEGTFREETVYAVVFWVGLSVGDRRTLAAFLPVTLWEMVPNYFLNGDKQSGYESLTNRDFKNAGNGNIVGRVFFKFLFQK